MRHVTACLRVTAIMAVAGSAHAATRVVTIYNAARIDRPPVIDGQLTDPCWQARPAITNMVLRDKEERTPARLQTRTTVVYDDEALYVGMWLEETNPEALRKSCVQYDGQIWWDDSVELYIGPGTGHREYFKFITNPVGTRHDVRGRQAGYSFVMLDWGTGTAWETRAAIGRDCWSLEFRIPWADFETAPPAPGDVWMFEPVRFRYANADGQQRGVEYSSWNVGATYNRPDRYGNIVFSGGQLDEGTLLRERLAPALGDDLVLYGPDSETRYLGGRTTTAPYTAVKGRHAASVRAALDGLNARLAGLPAGVPEPARADLRTRLTAAAARLDALSGQPAGAALSEALATLQGECDAVNWALAYREKLAALPATAPPAPAVPAAAGVDELTEHEYLLRPGDDGIPVTKWLGDRYARGSLSVLVIYGNPLVWELHGRKLLELKRALNLEMAYAEAAWFRAGGPPQVDDERIRRLLGRRRWNAVFFWMMPYAHSPGSAWDLLDDQTRCALLDAAAGQGTGLLFLQPDRPADLCAAAAPLPVKGDAVFDGLALLGRTLRDGAHGGKPEEEAAYRRDLLSAYQVGKGRAVVLDCSRMALAPRDGLTTAHDALSWSPDNRTDPEYCQAELARALLAAAGKEPRVTFTAAPAGVLDLPWGATAGRTLGWTLDARRAPRRLAMEWRVRDLTGAVVHTRTRRLARGDAVAATLSLPALAAGRYYVDVFVDSAAGRETYGFAAVRVVAPLAVTVALDLPAVEPGEPVTGTVTVAAASGAPTGATADAVVLRLVDGVERVVALSEAPARLGEKVPFTFATGDLHGTPLRVEAEALIGGRRAGWGVAGCNLLHRRQDRFNVVLWGGATGPYAHWSRRSIARTGVTAMLSPEGAGANMTFVPFVGGLRGGFRGKEFSGDVRHLVNPVKDPATGVLMLQPAPWNDAAAFEEILALTDQSWQKGREQPVLCYNLYDEGPHSAMDLSPPGLAAYRAFLKEQYRGDLAALNAEWGSTYAAWDDVAPLEQDEAAARERGDYARWSDRQHFGQVNFCRTILAGFTRRARQVDPFARVGFEGSGGFGLDFDELFATSGFWCPYDGVPLEIVRSQRPAGYVYGFWTGYDKAAEPLLSQSWRMVVNGAPSIWWWMLAGTGTFHGWLARDDRPYPAGQRLVDDCVLPLRQGLGDLLIRMDQSHDGIGLYYSVAAAHAGEFTGQDFNSVNGAAESLNTIVQDCGYQWLYFTKRALLDGQVESRGVKVLFLPFIQTLGQDEVDALRRFCGGGGTVIADLRPGVLSGHCRPAAHGPADALFGVERTGPGRAVKLDGDVAVALAGARIPLSLRNNRADADLKPAGAVAGATVAGQPVFLVNSIGTGRAILLNFHLTQYNGQRDAARGRQMRASFRALAAALGLAPQLALANPDGGDAPYPEVTTWRKGGVTIHSLFEGNGPVEAVLLRPAFVFDWRAGALGRTDRFSGELRGAGDIRFVAAYPYDPGTPVVTASSASAGGGDTIEFAMAMDGVPADETGVFSYHTSLFDPKGEWVDAIPWSVQGVGGKAAVRVRFAHSDAPGAWKLHVREITTGRTGQATVAIANPARRAQVDGD